MIIIFKDPFPLTALPIKAKFYVEPPWEGETKVYTNGPGHMTKTAATSLYSKSLQKILSYRTSSPIIMKLGMEYYKLKFYTVYINDDPELTLTNFTAMSNLAKLVFVHLLVFPNNR